MALRMAQRGSCQTSKGTVPLSRRRAASVVPRAAASATGARLSLHVGPTTISMPFTSDQAQKLDAALTQLLQTFAEKAKAERPKRWDMLELRFRGDPSQGELELLEFACNPNAAASPFDAKLLVTLKAPGGVAVVTEGPLLTVKNDLDAFKQRQGP